MLSVQLYRMAHVYHAMAHSIPRKRHTLDSQESPVQSIVSETMRPNSSVRILKTKAQKKNTKKIVIKIFSRFHGSNAIDLRVAYDY